MDGAHDTAGAGVAAAVVPTLNVHLAGWLPCCGCVVLRPFTAKMPRRSVGFGCEERALRWGRCCTAAVQWQMRVRTVMGFARK